MIVVSVIVPCYNGQHFIENALHSVGLAEDENSVELIIIDDGSTDGSLEIIKSFATQYPTCVRWESASNQGAPAARNRGLELAKGKYIKFLDADDVLLPGCLKRQVTQAEALPSNQKTAVYGDAVWIDEMGNSLVGYPHRPRAAGEDPIVHILTQSPLTSCPLHQRSYLMEVGGFDTAIYGPDESDLHLRLVLAGVDFVYHPGNIYQYRQHVSPNRITGQMHKRNKPLALYEVLQKQIRLIEAQTGQPLTSEVRRTLAQRFWAYGRGVLREGYSSQAQLYFQEAQRLDALDYVMGSGYYSWLVKYFGPFRAEQVMQLLKQVNWVTSMRQS